MSVLGTRRALLGLGLGFGFGLPTAAGVVRALGAGTGSPPIRLVNAPLPPYVMEPDEPSGEGPDIELARQALRLGAGQELALELLPWRRVLLELQEGRADFTTSVSPAQGQRPWLRFSRPYGESVRYSFFARRGSEPLREAGALRARQVGRVAGFALPPGLTALLPETTEQAKDLQTLLRMLAAGRIELAVANQWPARWLAQRLQLGDKLEEQPFVFDAGRRTHFGVSLKRDPDGLLLQALDRGLRELERKRFYETLLARYVAAP